MNLAPAFAPLMPTAKTQDVKRRASLWLRAATSLEFLPTVSANRRCRRNESVRPDQSHGFTDSGDDGQQ